MTYLTSENSNVRLSIEDEQLQLRYTTRSGKAIYDICSMEGRILHTGEIDGLGESQVDISGMRNGYYNVFILDGGEVHKEQFMLVSEESL